MSDIVKRLRNPIRIKTDYGLELDRREAADRIEQLQALLRDIYSYAEDQGMETLMDMIDASDSATHRENERE